MWCGGLSCSASRGILVPRPGIERACPAWQGRCLTLGPPEKSFVWLSYWTTLCPPSFAAILQVPWPGVLKQLCLLTQLYPTLCNLLEWVAMSFSRGPSQPGVLKVCIPVSSRSSWELVRNVNSYAVRGGRERSVYGALQVILRHADL